MDSKCGSGKIKDNEKIKAGNKYIFFFLK